ncbi:SWIM zinc finger family protein [Thorsellia anophelis]|uniref:SWIM zinc finger n=1 Tax=Thorsellia anophelis DSM 18579 TaxID=1123402 RepID=A0A1I0CN97_9GAMM|nr:SWIM zinc finger family protein [Thorsellia anophelis]SET20958.1 SWIM zinc finger [Thorsellia anophelis DSM 18579]
MHKRIDLLELSNDALVALSNVGFVKRATKEIAAGNIPEIKIQDDLTLSAQFEDGHSVQLADGKGLREANCTCPASGMCRHRVTLVLAYQATYQETDSHQADSDLTNSWSFSAFNDQIQMLPKSILNKANKLVANRIVVQLDSGKMAKEVPHAKLPMCDVRFFSKNNLSHAKCDCIEERICEHIIIAVWAFEQANNDLSKAEILSVEVNCKNDANAVQNELAQNIFENQTAQLLDNSLSELFLQLWMEGSNQPQSILEGLLSQSINYAQKLGWYWIIESLIEIRALINDQHNRSTRYHPLIFLESITNLTARVLAAKQMANMASQSLLPKVPASDILGLGIKGEVKLSHTKLISLGTKLWSDEQHEGVKLLFIDPDTHAVLNLIKQWPKIEDDESGYKNTLSTRKLAGTSLNKLASSQVITNAAKRLANGMIEFKSNKQNTTILPLSPTSWDLLGEPIRQPSANALCSYLNQSNPDFIRPKQLTDQLFILPVTHVLDWGWDAALHCLDIKIISTEEQSDQLHEATVDNIVHIQFKYDPISPNAVDVLARAMFDEISKPKLISGIAKLKGGKLYLEPLAVISETSVHVLCIDSAKPFSLDKFIDLQQQSQIECILTDIEEALARCLETGIRYQNNKLRNELTLLSKKIEEQGFSYLANQILSVLEIIFSEKKDLLTKTLCIVHQQIRLINQRINH